ncbi:unnamed protein product [Rotaria magnacalcarata]|uniref:CCHC-type domain-containing protein n=3 Tax=Rotaria magnacalcarata TaxID=392030 RepID=A0A819YQW0_9BILA|nr:unnamed protein product [Rotaria magnacalcarata]CAF4163967.1 unnamed protein product [Rotaria magnacalcarata]
MLTRQGAKRLLEAEFQRLSDIDIAFADRITVAPIVYRPTELLMTEKTVATLLSKTLEQIPKYSGKPDQNADEWMKDLTAEFHMADITESQALKIISTFLDGHPKQWFIENITIFESWNVFKTQFLHIYSSASSKQLASNHLRTRQQRYDEAVIEYYTDAIKLCKLVDPNMTDASKLDHFYHGLKSSLMKDVLRGAPSTPADFLEQARREENLDRLVTTSIPRTNDNDTQAINYSNNSWCRSTQSAEPIRRPNSSNIYSGGYSTTGYSPRPVYNRFHHQSSPRYPSQAQQSSSNALHYQSRPLRCYLCNKPGHFGRDCRSEKKLLRESHDGSDSLPSRPSLFSSSTYNPYSVQKSNIHHRFIPDFRNRTNGHTIVYPTYSVPYRKYLPIRYSRQHFIKPIEQHPVINQNIHKPNPSLIFINTLINGSRLRAMIDTGVTHSFINQGALSTLYHSAIPSCDRIAQLGDGQTTLKIVDEIQLEIMPVQKRMAVGIFAIAQERKDLERWGFHHWTEKCWGHVSM